MGLYAHTCETYLTSLRKFSRIVKKRYKTLRPHLANGHDLDAFKVRVKALLVLIHQALKNIVITMETVVPPARASIFDERLFSNGATMIPNSPTDVLNATCEQVYYELFGYLTIANNTFYGFKKRSTVLNRLKLEAHLTPYELRLLEAVELDKRSPLPINFVPLTGLDIVLDIPLYKLGGGHRKHRRTRKHR